MRKSAALIKGERMIIEYRRKIVTERLQKALKAYTEFHDNPRQSIRK